MLGRRYLLTSLGAAALTSPVRAEAVALLPFEEGRFLSAQSAGVPILVAIEASWCPTCQAQKPILSSLLERPGFKDIVALSVDFDSQKNVVRQFNARVQSTLIVFRGATEVGRSVGDTDARSIEKLLARAV